MLSVKGLKSIGSILELDLLLLKIFVPKVPHSDLVFAKLHHSDLDLLVHSDLHRFGGDLIIKIEKGIETLTKLKEGSDLVRNSSDLV